MYWNEENFLFHYRHSPFRGTLPMPSFAGTEVNPSCVILIPFQGIINGDILEKIRFEGSGCVISQASASLLAEYLEGKPIQNAVQFTPEDMQINCFGFGPYSHSLCFVSSGSITQWIEE